MAQYVANQTDDVGTTSSGLGAGAGAHLPIGDYGGMDYRSAMRFVAAPGWAAWTAITSATLKVFITDFQHVAPKSSSIFCSRMDVPVWSKAQGTQNCDSGGFSGSNTSQYTDIQSTAANRISFTSGATANAAKTLDVTAMVQYYWANRSNMVFVFDNNGSSQYSELWSLGASGTQYNAVLTINYDVQSPPTAPDNLAPAGGVVSVTQTPTFSWTHHDPQSDPQASAEVRVWDAAGTTQVGATQTVSGATASLVWPVALPRGVAYQWDVRTADAANGLSPTWSAKASFSVKALPTVTITPTRFMEYNGAPRLRVYWTGGPQTSYLVTGPSGYTSGPQTSPNQNQLLDTLNLTNGTAVSITVQITDPDGLTNSATLSFTPRWGLTAHKKTLLNAPVNWGTPALVSTTPSGTTLVIEYGQAATAGATVPTAWFSSPTAFPKPYTQYLHWRAWFIPSATVGPTLDTISLPYDQTVVSLDKWGGESPFFPWQTPPVALPAAFSIDTGEAVYGTRSLRCDKSAAAYDVAYSAKFKVRAGRSYILSGLIKSQGNAAAQIRLQDAGTVYTVTPQITTTGLTQWADQRSPVWVAPADMDVFVSCICWLGVVGATAWFDGIKVEESTVATPWGPGAVGATTLDAGGVQVDATKGGVFRVRGSAGGARDVVESGVNGLLFGGDTPLSAPSPNTLQLGSETGSPGGTLTLAGGTDAAEGGQLDLLGAGALTDWHLDNFQGRVRFFDVAERIAIRAVSPQLSVGGDIALSGVLRMGGSSFAGLSPASGDTFFRTDLGRWYYWNGSAWLLTAASELDYVESTGSVGPLATTEAAATVILTGANLAYPGGMPVMVEFFSPFASPTSGQNLRICLFDNGASLGQVGILYVPSTQPRAPVHVSRRLTPGAGNHQFSIRAFCDTAGGSLAGGVGGTGNFLPQYLRTTRA